MLDTLKDNNSVKGQTRQNQRTAKTRHLKEGLPLDFCFCEGLFGLHKARARNLQSPKASALSVLECTNVLKGQKTALKDDSVVEEITSKVMTCASKIRLKIVTDDVSIL